MDKIKQDIHEIEDITDGYQKWHGTLPSFNIMATISNMITLLGYILNGIHIAIPEIRSRADPKACAKKYFTDPSVSWLLFVCIIIGINLIRFNSMALPRIIQFALVKAIKVLIMRDINANIIVGDHIKIMKITKELNPLNKS